MAQPIKRGGVYWLRKKVPLDRRSHEGKTEEKFSLKTRDPVQARVLFAKANAEIEQKWARLRQGIKSPVSLKHAAGREFIDQEFPVGAASAAQLLSSALPCLRNESGIVDENHRTFAELFGMSETEWLAAA